MTESELAWQAAMKAQAAAETQVQALSTQLTGLQVRFRGGAAV